jgi:hypothetical protein
MAPLPRLAGAISLLLLAAAASVRAQSDDARAAILAQAARQKQAAANAVVARAGLPLDPAKPESLPALGWSGRNLADLGPAITAAGRAVADLHAKYPSAVADAYGSGTMTNIEDTFKLFGGGNLERGCISHQTVTFAAVKPVLAGSSLEVRKIRELSHGAFPHNAVVVFPKGADWKSAGVVFDGWKRQKSDPDKMTYLFKDWYGALDVDAHLIGDDE